MTAKILDFARPVNGVIVEQRITDGFINGTAMAVAHKKDITQWFRTRDVLELFIALADDLNQNSNPVNLQDLDVSRLSPSKYAEMFPFAITVKRGSPETGGGTWLHPDIAVQLAQHCNKPFAIQVSRWIREWLTTGKNPIQVDVDQEFIAWQQRHDIRVFLKDFLRPELMDAVVKYAIAHKESPIKLASSVHDLMNKRIQGATSQEIKILNDLPIGSLIRDYFDSSPLIAYVGINQLAKNAIVDNLVHPLTAVDEACDRYLGKAYVPTLAPIVGNLYLKGEEIKQRRLQKQSVGRTQLTIFDVQQSA
jgi:KilA-N domain